MLSQLAYVMLFGKPLIMYGGLASFTLLLATASITFFNARGVTHIPLIWHKRLAVLTIIAAFFHGLLGLSIYFGF